MRTVMIWVGIVVLLLLLAAGCRTMVVYPVYGGPMYPVYVSPYPPVILPMPEIVLY